jgi:hypothetical protein
MGRTAEPPRPGFRPIVPVDKTERQKINPFILIYYDLRDCRGDGFPRGFAQPGFAGDQPSPTPPAKFQEYPDPTQFRAFNMR